ncbi:unnamed protein product [Auanema sp. JU1783]|nr:unnamed protein product [Auanema sp. JU1783]
MSFLNIKARLAQKSPTADSALSHLHSNDDVRRKISCTSGCDVPQVVVGSPDSQSSDSSSAPYLPGHKQEDCARLFICDRRRAILEKVIDRKLSTHNGFQICDPGKIPPNIFLAEQYADTSSNHWAYRFDFNHWIDQYSIEELCFQNFCSFLDREHGKMEMEGSPGSLDSRRGGNPQNTMLTPPWSGDSRSPTGGPNTVGPTEGNTAYHRLPSSQSANFQEQHAVLDDEASSMMSQLSAGRLERLIKALSLMNPSHIVFRDHSCYPHRPTLLLFWFLKLLPYKISRLTFDGMQSDSRIKLHEVLDMDDLEELNVIQPGQRAAFAVTPELLTKWLKSSSEKLLRLSVTGASEMTPASLANFIREWRATPVPRIFDTITFDAASLSVIDFVHEISGPGRNVEWESDWRPPTPPPSGSLSPMFQSSQNRQFTFKHKKGQARVHYKHVDGLLVFTCISATQGSTLPGLPRAASEQAFTHYRKNSTGNINGNRSLHRITTFNSPLAETQAQPNQDQSQTLKFMDRMFGFLLRSNA